MSLTLAPVTRRRFRVDLDRVREVRLALAPLSLRAERLGLGSLDIAIESFDDHAILSIASALPTLGDWQLVGRVHHRDGQTNLVMVLPGFEALDLSRFANAESTCEHCSVRRRRRQTFVLARRDEVMQVGTSCVAAFTMAPDVDAILRQGDYLIRAESALTEVGAVDLDRPAPEAVPLETFAPLEVLARAASLIASDGWLSRTDAERREDSTADRVLHSYREGGQAITLRRADWARASACLTWARAHLDGATRYQRNMATALAPEEISEHEVAVVVAALPGYERSHPRAGRSRHVSDEMIAPGLPVTVQYVGRGKQEGTAIVTLRDQWGNRLTHFCAPGETPAVGTTHMVRATRIEHSTVSGERVTTLRGASLSPLP